MRDGSAALLHLVESCQQVRVMSLGPVLGVTACSGRAASGTMDNATATL